MASKLDIHDSNCKPNIKQGYLNIFSLDTVPFCGEKDSSKQDAFR